MTELLADPAAAAPRPHPQRDSVRGALMESRQRWQHLVSLAADLAFETDAEGRFVFMIPATVLGWPAATLIGGPSTFLVAEDVAGVGFNPFFPAAEVRRHRTWLRRADGGLALIALSATPVFDAAGVLTGARGIGVDLTDSDAQVSRLAGRLRRGQVLHHILTLIARETGADRMMDAALLALVHALGAEGAAVIGAVTEDAPVEVLHDCGPGAPPVLATASRLLTQAGCEPSGSSNPDGRIVLAVGCQTRFSAHAGLVVWRGDGARPWDNEDKILAGSAVYIVRMILEYESLQQEMTHQARTDPLTGLLNRRAFIEQMRRQIARLDRVSEPGTLMFVDMDSFKAVNDRLGHGVGDQVLTCLAALLLTLVRPSDLVTRLGGDEFAVWLDGADHMTAAERADTLCKAAPAELQAILPEPFPRLGVSVGIATRTPGSHETIEALLWRADMAMYEVKRTGRRHWRVSLLDGA